MLWQGDQSDPACGRRQPTWPQSPEAFAAIEISLWKALGWPSIANFLPHAAWCAIDRKNEMGPASEKGLWQRGRAQSGAQRFTVGWVDQVSPWLGAEAVAGPSERKPAATYCFRTCVRLSFPPRTGKES
ncbi:hypothetical protein CBM2588_A120185 [Cupriavidus taiwanensis]|nr:hypothetical protein CBM2588_A120185 [Cupriavidus taiwanensis]